MPKLRMKTSVNRLFVCSVLVGFVAATFIGGAGLAQAKDLVIGVSMPTLGAPYYAAQAEAAQNKGKEVGATVIVTDAGGDMVKQLGDVEDMLAQGIDLLILNPQDPKGLIPAAESAKDAGVPVVIMDSGIDPSAEYVTMVQSNNSLNGELVGEWLGEKMGGKPFKMALLSGAQGNPVGKARRDGLFVGILEYQLRSAGSASFEVVAQGWGAWAQAGGLAAMEDILVAHPDINVVAAENDSMALGAYEAIKEAGKEHDILIVAAADAQKEALEMIKDGKYGATGLNSPSLVAETAIDMGMRFLNGETKLPKTYYTTPVCITADNVDEFYNPDAKF